MRGSSSWGSSGVKSKAMPNERFSTDCLIRGPPSEEVSRIKLFHLGGDSHLTMSVSLSTTNTPDFPMCGHVRTHHEGEHYVSSFTIASGPHPSITWVTSSLYRALYSHYFTDARVLRQKKVVAQFKPNAPEHNRGTAYELNPERWGAKK